MRRSLIIARQAFSPSCPSGGTFYACQTGTNFVGCCASEACSSGCSDGNLEPASFNPAYYGQFQDQQCPTGSRWYTCTATSPPFMGCCKINPCSNGGCPVGDLTAGFLSSNQKAAADFLPSSAVSSSQSSASATSSTSSPSPSSTQTSAAAATTSNAASPQQTGLPGVSAVVAADQHTSTGTIVGASIGGAVAVILLILLVVFTVRRRTSRSRRAMTLSRTGEWGAGKETTDVRGAGYGVAEGTPPFKDSNVAGIKAQELMASSVPMHQTNYASTTSELDVSRPVRRASLEYSELPSSSEVSPMPPSYHDSPVSSRDTPTLPHSPGWGKHWR